jgi:Dolichyl-phosphate-mannose-protein mannosyltransferase
MNEMAESIPDARNRVAACCLRDTAVLTLAMLTALFMVAQLLDFGYGRDQGIYATVARAIRAGGVPYRDAWDFKPPGIFFVYALADAVAGHATWAIRILEAICLLSLLPAFGFLSRVYLNDARPGIFGATLAILTHVQLEFWHTAQPESFGAVCVAWAVLAASVAIEGGESLSPARVAGLWVTSGAFYGAAALLKPTIGVAGIASLLAGLGSVRPCRLRIVAFARIAVPFAAGMAVTVCACAFFLTARGAWREFTEAVLIFAPHYTGISWPTDPLNLVQRLLADWLFGYSLLNVVGLLLLATVPVSARRLRGVLHISGAIVLLLIGIGIQLKLFAYHFGAVLPLTGFLAGVGYWGLWTRVRGSWSGLAVFAALVLVLAGVRSATIQVRDGFLERCRLRVVAWADPAERAAIRARLYSVADYFAGPNRDAAEWITHSTPKDSSIFIWGFTPELYVMSDRALMSRYIYNVPQRAAWSRDAARAELMDDLARRPPSAVLVEYGDRIPMVTGSHTDSASELQTFVALRSFLTTHYRRVGHNDKFDFYTQIE